MMLSCVSALVLMLLGVSALARQRREYALDERSPIP
jgi:hypothetical protein